MSAAPPVLCQRKEDNRGHDNFNSDTEASTSGHNLLEGCYKDNKSRSYDRGEDHNEEMDDREAETVLLEDLVREVCAILSTMCLHCNLIVFYAFVFYPARLSLNVERNHKVNCP